MKNSIVILIIAACVAGCARGTQEKVYNQQASVSAADSLDFNPLEGKVINSFIQAGNQTMSTLYGNETAIKYARNNGGDQYPVGSVLSLVTWHQQADDRWFGANIPANIQSVEVVRYEATNNEQATAVYQYYTGKPLRLSTGKDNADSRVAWMANEKVMLMP